MNRIAMIVVVSALVAGCDIPHCESTNGNSLHVETMRGHDFVVMGTNGRYGKCVIHAPFCKCLEKPEERK